MLSYIWAQVRARAGRSFALLVGMLVATTGFTVLTGTTSTSQLRVTGTVDESAHAAYDLLVRPKGSRTALEDERGLVRPNHLSGLFGGITTQQYEQLKSVPGIDVAAPIAMIGYGDAVLRSTFDLTDLVNRGAERQVLRLDRTFLANRGLSSAPANPMYVYVTKNPIAWATRLDTENIYFSDGRQLKQRDVCADWPLGELELPPGAAPQPICPNLFGPKRTSFVTDRDYSAVVVVRMRPDGRFEQGYRPESTKDRLEIDIRWTLPYLLAGVDPAAENRLVGLDAAVDTGRTLKPADAVTTDYYTRSVPALAASRSYTDSGIAIAVSRVGPGVQVTGPSTAALTDRLAAAPTTPIGRFTRNADDDYRTMATDTIRRNTGFIDLQHLIQTGPTVYDQRPDGTLVPRTLPADPEAYRTPSVHGLSVPWQIDDAGFRPLRGLQPERVDKLNGVTTVGTFDPERLNTFNPLSKVPLETYEPPGVSGADRRSRDLLGGQPLGPDTNPAGYVASPPLLLTTLTAADDLFRAVHAGASIRAPISAIRIRVAGVRGYSEASRERVRLVAEEIATRTGLDVDITYGSSPAPQTIALAAGRYGRPALMLSEGWTKKGVAATIISAVDRKSLVLFSLVLVVCVLFLANAVAAAVRDRRSQLAVLACLGWPGRRIAASILGEVTALGLVAGVASLPLAALLSGLFGIGITWRQALLAVPVALGLALVAGVWPAVRAAGAHPAGALRPPVARAHRVRQPRTVVGLGLVNLTRVPGRTALGAASLAIGVAALTVLVAITVAFRGTLVGTILGEAVSLRIRGVDAVAVAATVLLGALAVSDVLYLNVRDRAPELATLRATGWSDGALARLIAAEGLGIGVLGGLLGAAAGLAGAAWLVGSLPTDLIIAATITASIGALLATAASLLPAALIRRLPTAQLLAEE